MEDLFEAESVLEMKSRIAILSRDNQPLWGRMNVAQAMAHCTAGFQMAMGEIRPPRALIGRLIGGLIKTRAFRDGEPMRRNSPTARELLVADERDLELERVQLLQTLDRFTASGTQRCTMHPHAFFGPLTPKEWSMLMYKHLDHHLRQFGI
jgi:hypothetical protein